MIDHHRVEHRTPRTPRTYFCNTCGHTEQGVVPPHGWFTASRHSGLPEIRPGSLGYFCSPECMIGGLGNTLPIEPEIGNALTMLASHMMRFEKGSGRS